MSIVVCDLDMVLIRLDGKLKQLCRPFHKQNKDVANLRVDLNKRNALLLLFYSFLSVSGGKKVKYHCLCFPYG